MDSISSIRLEAQGSRLAVQYRENMPRAEKPNKGALRGRINKFSSRSRKRLLDMTASLDLQDAVSSFPIIFVTLTYGQKFPEAEDAKRHLDNFKKRLVRFAPECSGLWRLEFQKRGAPHFHFILFNLPFLPMDELARWWGEIIGLEFWDTSQDEPRPPFTRIEALKNPRKVFSYVSKYVAKMPDTPTNALETERSDCGFNNVPYFTAEDWTGRFWGILNRKCLPFAELFETESECDEVVERAFFQFRRLMAHKWDAANHFGKHKGATIYVWVGADSWLDAWIQCLFDAQDEYASRN